MVEKTWPDFVKKAWHDAWLDSIGIPGRDEQIDVFMRKWGEVNVGALKKALTGDEINHRLFAIFALSYLAPGDGETYVLPFLQSSIRKERWASTIALGRWRFEPILPLLLNLLQEDLAYTPPFDFPVNQEPVPAKNERQRREEMDRHYQKEYDWLSLHRLRIILLLASWQDFRINPALVQAFSLCLGIERKQNDTEIMNWVYDYWHRFQDHVAYVLGQRGAWNAPDSLDLSLERLHIMRMYMVYGALHAMVPLAFCGYDMPLSYLGISSEQVTALLKEQFNRTDEDCLHYFQNFIRYYDKRANGDRSQERY